MKTLSSGTVIPGVLALVLFVAIGCGGQSESGEAEGEEATAEMEAVSPAMAAGGEEGEESEESEEADEEGGEEHGEGGERAEHREEGEHGEEGEHSEEEEHGEEGEESGVYIARDATWDAVRRGIRLTLSYDAERDAFMGTVENATEATVCAVRVEVHLANGPELGPTDRQDIAAGGSGAVELSAEGEDFETWTAHPEVSACG